MRANDSATVPTPIAVATPTSAPAAPLPAPQGRAAGSGAPLAVLGVASFSLTFPGTAWALEGMGPWTVVMLRNALAAVLAGACLAACRTRMPERRHWFGIAVVAAGVVLGFPILTTLALQTSTTSHAAVVVGLLPLTTAAYSAVRTGSRPSRTFWIAALVGAVFVIAFAVQQSGGTPSTGDLYLFAALALCAAGYGEGGRLARQMPGWQVIGWALVVALPVTVLGGALSLYAEPAPRWTGHSVAGLVWLAVGSTFLGMMVWYRGMAAIGISRASQLQLAQPLLTLVWSVALLGEHLPPAAPLTALGVLACIVVTQRARS